MARRGEKATRKRRGGRHRQLEAALRLAAFLFSLHADANSPKEGHPSPTGQQYPLSWSLLRLLQPASVLPLHLAISKSGLSMPLRLLPLGDRRSSIKGVL